MQALRILSAVLFSWFMVISVAHADPLATQDKAKQTWQLLDYLAVDYGGAVRDGKVQSASEYEEMKGPSGMHIDKDGNLYVLDLGEVPVVILSPTGKFISKIGDFGNQPGSFLYPTGVIAKSAEEIYVLDNSRNTILNFKKKPE